jgi:YjbE family integral membrane protein
MEFLSDPSFWWKWLSIVLIDLVLAGDNALVIALAVRSLPPREQLYGRIFGTVGAIVLRLLFIAIVTWLLSVPYLRLMGGVLLIWIAIKLVRQCCSGSEESVREGASLSQAVGIIILADVVMSLDNVIAISAAARGDLILVVFGLLLSLPLVVWGSGVLARLMNKFPFIIWLGGGVLGWVAVKMMLDDPAALEWLGASLTEALHWIVPIVAACAISAMGWWFARGTARAKGGEEPVT